MNKDRTEDALTRLVLARKINEGARNARIFTVTEDQQDDRGQ
jgi:hypothetical protein